jgi:hypothetical protein
MCAALNAHGVAAGHLLPTATRPGGADLIVASESASSQFGARLGDGYTPVLIASFGSGPNLIQVHAISPGGRAAYNSALHADLAARRSAGAQLLHSGRLEVSALSAQQLQAGEVDSRLLVTLAALASLQPMRVIVFGDASPGEQAPLTEMPFRQVIVTRADSRGGAAGLSAALAMASAQRAPYQPAQVTTVDLGAGHAGLLIEFATPSPLGLLGGVTSG